MSRPSLQKTDFAKALQASGYTRKQFVTISGYSPSAVEKFCSGERACPPGHRAFLTLKRITQPWEPSMFLKREHMVLVDAGFKSINWLTQQELKELQAAKWELKDAE